MEPAKGITQTFNKRIEFLQKPLIYLEKDGESNEEQMLDIREKFRAFSLDQPMKIFIVNLDGKIDFARTLPTFSEVGRNIPPWMSVKFHLKIKEINQKINRYLTKSS